MNFGSESGSWTMKPTIDLKMFKNFLRVYCTATNHQSIRHLNFPLFLKFLGVESLTDQTYNTNIEWICLSAIRKLRINSITNWIFLILEQNKSERSARKRLFSSACYCFQFQPIISMTEQEKYAHKMSFIRTDHSKGTSDHLLLVQFFECFRVKNRRLHRNITH